MSLPRAASDDLAADLEKQAVYAAPGVAALRVAADRRTVTVTCEPGADEAAVRAKVERYVAAMVEKFRPMEKRVMATTPRARRGALATGVYADLKRRGWVHELGRGQVGFTGPALRAHRAFDAAFTRLGVEHFGAQDAAYPTLIPSTVLARCGYFTSFPHSVSMVVHLLEAYDLHESFRQANGDGQTLTIPAGGGHLGAPEACLQPAVCYHCYQALEGQTLAKGHVTTAVGRCFRYESKNITGLDRLWDFSMREIIFVGTEAWVAAERERAIGLVTAMLERWGLGCSIDSANDPVFAPACAPKTVVQVPPDLKYEMRLDIEPGPDGEARSIAAGSFNLHEGFFGRTFAITAEDGQPAFTGCTAFGLDRWVLAAFTQYGGEPADWPAELRKEVFA